MVYGGHHYCLQTVPVLTDFLQDKEWDRMTHTPFHQHHITVMATELISYSFAVYGFNSGHFLQLNHRAPFDVILAADTRPYDSALFKPFTWCPSISNSVDELLKRIHSCSNSSTIHELFIHAHRFREHRTKQTFWTVQSAIV